MSRLIRGTLLGLVLVTLASCGTLYSYNSGGQGAAQADAAVSAGSDSLSLSGFRQAVAGLFGRAPTPPRPEQVLTPQALAQITQPYLLVFLETNGGLAMMRLGLGWPKPGSMVMP